MATILSMMSGGGRGEHLEMPKLVTPPRALVFYSELI